MSSLVSALSGEAKVGYVTVRDPGPVGMVSLKGAPEDVADAVRATVGVDLPQVRRNAIAGDVSVLWMAPDEVLILCPRDDAASLTTDLNRALKGVHNLVADVSDARAVLILEGSALREVLAKVCPADLRPASLPEGEVRRTRLAQVPCAFWISGAETAHVLIYRSVARYAFDVLATVATPGSEVGLFD